ncbi:MAG TPA: hypothetical protein VN648_08810 [Candidatus Methylomirabilis sp.]|nr:hypothetical protein [Candidatus Methylomirabilis sp.]
MQEISSLNGKIPYRLALAGGWIDQPFVSRANPEPPGAMVVVGLEPVYRFMDRSGMATSTRKVAHALWNGCLPEGDPAEIVRILYQEENRDKSEPSGSQDMAGLVYPGVNRLDYDASYEGGYFPAHVESCNDPAVARWLEEVIYMVPVSQRPLGYSPLGIKCLDPEWIRRLGQTGRDCYSAITSMDLPGLGASMNECMRCWESILPQTVRHPALQTDLVDILCFYQGWTAGAMYSGCGGGYLVVASDQAVPGSIRIKVRTQSKVE